MSANISAHPFAPPAGGCGLSARGWEDYAPILARIQAPQFPDNDFPITHFGAIGDGHTDASDAIRRAIDACHAAGGGRVIVPGGAVFLTGAIHLKSQVNLHIEAGATLRFTPDPARYPLVHTRWEGVECMNFSPLIYAYGQENIAITGKGTLDGGAARDNWWDWNIKPNPKQDTDRDLLLQMGEDGIPVEQRIFGPGHLLRPSFIQPYACRNVLIEGLSIINSPMWELHPVLCQNVSIRGITIHAHGPNNDGCDPESCLDVLIEDCVFDTGDDCIAIKSGRNNDGRRLSVPTENVIIRQCKMQDGHGGVVLGSECSGHIRNVFIERCEMDSPNLDRALRFKNNAARGAILENVFMRDVTIGRVGEAVLTIDLMYEEGANGKHKPMVRNVQLANVNSSASPRVMFIAGYANAEIDNIRFADCTFSGLSATDVLSGAGRIEMHNITLAPAQKVAGLNSIPYRQPPV